MATAIKESVDYPMISTSAWWKLRKQFQQTMPPRVTVNTLASFFGMTPKSVGINVLSPLRKMGLIDSEGRTTDLANRWRDNSQYPLVCEEIRKAIYPQDLLDTFPGPDSPRASIEQWFAIEAGVGESAKKKMAKLYLLLAEANPTKQEGTSKAVKAISPGKTPHSSLKSKGSTTAKGTMDKSNGNAPAPLSPEPMQNIQTPRQHISGIGPSLHIDIQIHIPPDASADQIDHIFESMSKHLYKGRNVNE